MQLERVKSELKRRFYNQNKFSGKTVNIRKRIFDLPRGNTFLKQRNVISRLRQGPWVLFHKNTGTLYKLYPTKGYLLILTVDQRTDGWNRFQAKERERAR
jgi:hypothetical protein